MFISKDVCPVPFDQQPLNEYISLKQSCFFSWSAFPINRYLNTLYTIIIFLLVLCIPFVCAIAPNKTPIVMYILLDMSLVTFILITVFIRLYLGWSYVIKRLVSATVFYEESGWYDGQIWVKTVEAMTKDRLVGLYEVTPYINRIKYSLLMTVLLFSFESLLLYLLE